jgi:L-gulonolactone oxidase
MAISSWGQGAHILNFGRNVRFNPRRYYVPENEAEVLRILTAHAEGTVRVVGALHSWSNILVSEDAVIDLRRFNDVEIERDDDGNAWAVVGAGVLLKDLLAILRDRGLTLPVLPGATTQTLAGCIATATHGSGLPSMSHYVDGVRTAAFDAQTGKARIHEFTGEDELLAARCSLGCMGVMLSIRIRCVPLFSVLESVQRVESVAEVLTSRRGFTFQEFILMPYNWSVYVFQRRPLGYRPEQESRLQARFYRAYKSFVQDFLAHWILILFLNVIKRPGAVRWLLKSVFPSVLLTGFNVVERNDRVLARKHELFRHIELELFVPLRHLEAAVESIREIISVFAGTEWDVSFGLAERLAEIGLLDALLEKRGAYTHHYPIYFRRVLPDETLISMTAGAAEDHYSISFFSYSVDQESFAVAAEFLALAINLLYEGRPHWGKFFPLHYEDVAQFYPRLAEFREVCRQVDPKGVFQNRFTRQVLGFDQGPLA